MRLKNLIRSAEENDLLLQQAIETDRPFDLIKLYDRTIEDLVVQIREFRPENRKDVSDKLAFFLNRIRNSDEMQSCRYALDAIDHIVDKDLQLGMRDIETNRALPECSVFSAGNSVSKYGNVFDLVTKSHDRISIIDTDFRYVNTSIRNSAFYEMDVDDVIGLHVGEVIGEQRFVSRAKRFLEVCFSGVRQEYFHSLDVDSEARIMNCQMIPLFSVDHQTNGAMVAMNDVTEVFSTRNTVFLEPLAC